MEERTGPRTRQEVREGTSMNARRVNTNYARMEPFGHSANERFAEQDPAWRPNSNQQRRNANRSTRRQRQNANRLRDEIILITKENHELMRVNEQRDAQIQLLERNVEEMRQEFQRALDREVKKHDKSQNWEAEENLVKERKKNEILHDQLFRLKQTVASSTRLDKQLGDETIQRSLDRMYIGIKDCFLQTMARENPDISIRVSGVEDMLPNFVPGYKENTEDEKVHLCIFIVSMVVMNFVNRQEVFNAPCDKVTDSATKLWHAFGGSFAHKNPKTKRQWLLLTDNLLAETHTESVGNAQKKTLQQILSRISYWLEGCTTLRVTESVRAALTDAILPCLEVLRSLHYQEWRFKMEMLTADEGGYASVFDRAVMEGMFGEEEGYVKASLFPPLSRMNESGDDASTDTWSVISKAKVALHHEST